MLIQRCVLALALLAAGTATPAAADVPATAADNAYWLVGGWQCQARVANEPSTTTYVRNADGSITLTTLTKRKAGGTRDFNETFRFDQGKNLWTWTSTSPEEAGRVNIATAGPWTSQMWLFEGTYYAQDIHTNGIRAVTRAHVPMRMLFVHLNDTSYERDFQVYDHGTWATTSIANCARLSAADSTP